MITVAHLKKAYGHMIPDQCCVGGSLCQVVGEPWRFPSVLDLQIALGIANPNLDRPSSYIFANRIIMQNEREKYDQAWATLDRALTYTGE